MCFGWLKEEKLDQCEEARLHWTEGCGSRREEDLEGEWHSSFQHA